MECIEPVAASDEDLIRRYAQGDAKSFEALYQRHELRVWRYLQRSVRNPAVSDELMQEVWFSVAREASRYEPSARFSTWLFAIAHNRMVNAIRAHRSHVSLDAMEESDAPAPTQLIDDLGYGPQAGAVALEQAEAMNCAVDSLPDEQREAFLLHVEGDLTVTEIAAVTSCTFETAKSRLRYARQKLRELLKEHL